MTREEELVPITARRRCGCGHFEERHSTEGLRLCQVNGCILCEHPISGRRGDPGGFRFSGYEPQEPTLTVEDENSHRSSTETHPAYAQVTVSRVQGSGVELYGTDFRHQHFIEISVWDSELHRGLSYDSPMAGRKYLTLALSEAQWAEFVASAGVGGGVQATLQWREGIGSLPGIKRTSDRRGQFQEEVRAHSLEARKALKAAKEAIAASGLSQKAKRELTQNMDTVAANTFGANAEFTAEQFDRHMERTIAAAKSEVNAYGQHLLGRVIDGQGALPGMPTMLEIEAPTEDPYRADMEDLALEREDEDVN